MNKFRLTDQFISKYKEIKPPFGFNGLGELVYLRCVTIDTLILCGDLKWRPAGELKNGDDLIAFTEEIDPITKERYLEKVKVIENTIAEDQCYGIQLENGKVLYCNGEHKWLVYKSKKDVTLSWIKTSDFYKHPNISLPLLIDPWDEDNSFESGYISGAYDGEGSVYKAKAVMFTQIENKVLENVERILVEKKIKFRKRTKKQYLSYKSYSFKAQKPCFDLAIENMTNVLKFFGLFNPIRLKEKFLINLEKNKAALRFSKKIKVVRVFGAGMKKIAVLSTTSKTYFADGYPSHNTYSRLKLDGENEQWFETVQRVVEGTFNMQKNWIEQHSLGWNPKKAQNSAHEMYDRIFNMKFLPPGRGLWAMGSPITEERGLFAALNNCLAGETKVLTSHGFKEIKTLVDQKPTLLSDNGQWIQSEVRQFGIQKLKKIRLMRQGIVKELYATDNHIWFAKSPSDRSNSKGYQQYITQELKPGFRMQYMFGQTQSNYSPQGIQHGICFGDGTLNHLYLIGEKDHELIRWFPLNRQNPAEEKNALRIADLPEHYKKLPFMTYDKKYLIGWLMGYFAADGSVDINGQITLSSSLRSNLEFAQNVAALCGLGTYNIGLSSESSNLKEDRELWKLTFMSDTLYPEFFILSVHKKNFIKEKIKRYWNIEIVEETNREEVVYCAVVPDTQSFTIEGNILTHNCAFVSTYNLKEDLASPFCFLMDASMLGVGCGFDIKGTGQIIIKKPKKEINQIKITDDRLGWVESVKKLLESFFLGGDEVMFDYSLIRKEGELIKGFGGVSSGYKPLEQCHKDLKEILNKNIDKPITTTCIVDIMNLIGKCVVSGNLRRTAEITFGDYNNLEYLDLKNYKKNPHRETYGWTSNNSVFADLGMKYKEAAQRTAINGEPGYAWIENMKGYSRMNNGPDNKDHRVSGGNPCLEQSLESYEMCCLVESFPNNHKTLDDYLITLKYAYLYAKTVTLGKTHWAETNRVMLRNRRIGCSMSGIAQFITKNGLHSLKQWCEEGYKAIEYYDTVYSDWLAIPKSIKKTSVKPSGSVSLVAGATPGMHFPESRFYIRRMRLSKFSELIKPLEKAGYTIEPCFGSEETTVVVEIPVDVGEGIRTIDQVSMWEQLSLAAFLQRYWADNQVSSTITFKEEEADQIEYALNYFQYQLKGVSFLPKLKKGAAYPQMPYEEIDEERYKEMDKKIKSIKFKSINNEQAEIERFCSNETCSISIK